MHIRYLVGTQAQTSGTDLGRSPDPAPCKFTDWVRVTENMSSDSCMADAQPYGNRVGNNLRGPERVLYHL